MIIHINRSLAELGFTEMNAAQGRTHYVLDDPLIALICRGFKIDDVAVGDYYDALIGWDQGMSGFVHQVGQKHTKLTLLSKLDESEMAGRKAMDVSEVIERAPRRDGLSFDAEAVYHDAVTIVVNLLMRLNHVLGDDQFVIMALSRNAGQSVNLMNGSAGLRRRVGLIVDAANGELMWSAKTADVVTKVANEVSEVFVGLVQDHQLEQTIIGQACAAATAWARDGKAKAARKQD